VGGGGIATVGNCFIATTSEDKGELTCAVAYCKVCELAMALQFLIVAIRSVQ
jgi:hypothetical protein